MISVFQEIPHQARKWLYVSYGGLGLILAAIQAAVAAAGMGSPVQLKMAFAVYAVFSSAIGATAASNVSPGSSALRAKPTPDGAPATSVQQPAGPAGAPN